MTAKLIPPDQVRALPNVYLKARAVRAFFEVEKDMRRLRDEVIRGLRAEGMEQKTIAEEVACSLATVKTALRNQS